MSFRDDINFENLQRAVFHGVGEYDIPYIRPTKVKIDKFIGFNYVKTEKSPESYAVHFFLDDYQFSRLWNKPEIYISSLSKFKALCTPDFSMYTNIPKVIQIYNHYKKHWLGAFWQSYGMEVIPTICWSDKSSYAWCFDGEPEGGAVAISSVGTQKDKESRKLFLDGYHEMLTRLQPSMIYFYGNVPDECKGNIVKIEAFQESLRKRIDRKQRGD